MGGENGSDRERGREGEWGSEGLGEVWRGMERYGRCRAKGDRRERVKVEGNRNGRDEGERVGYCMYTQKLNNTKFRARVGEKGNDNVERWERREGRTG